MSEEKQKWLAVYTRPRWEKKVYQLLQEQGITSYCPLNRVRKKWSDRIKMVEEPLLKSYVFVKVNENERGTVRLTSGVINFVYWNGKPAVIREKEIEAIRLFLDDYEQVEVLDMKIKIEDQVKLSSGPFMDKEGRVIAVQGRQAKVLIESLGIVLVAPVNKLKSTGK